MRSYRQVARVIANEGFAGVAKRLLPVAKSTPAVSPDARTSQIKEEFHRLANEFFARAEKMGRADLKDYYWYHTVDLGNGLITPGTYDYRAVLDVFQFPENMKGKSVLDVGSATGFFAFEFERRGADVTSLELPSIEDLDCFPGATFEQTTRNLDYILSVLQTYTADQLARIKSKPKTELYELLMDGPFQFCHQTLNSTVKRHYSRLYDLTPEIGTFDLVFMGDVLCHTINPLLALSKVAALCRNTLIIAQDTGAYQDTPVFSYVGGDQPVDTVAWWVPNNLALEQILKKMGFSEVRVVGKNVGQYRPMGDTFTRTVIHAERG
jgi:tRNA (mo5U34)-methyltransferase